MVNSHNPKRLTTSFKFKNYSEVKQQTKEIKHADYIALTVDSILHLVDDAKDTACEIQEFLDLNKTKQHIKAGKKLPKALLRKVEVLHSKLDSAQVCFREGVQQEIEDEESGAALIDLVHTAEEIVQVVDSLSVFARRSFLSRVALIKTLLQVIVTKASTARLKLIPYTKSATIATVPTNINIVRPPPQALFGEEDLAITSFLERAPARGFRVTEKQTADTLEGAKGLVDDDLENSFDLLLKLQKPLSSLLQNDVIVGVVQFPVVASNARRLPDALIQECIIPTLGYNFYLVLGDYLVIENMCLLGIHRSIMKVLDDRNKPQLDIDKFVALHPYLIAEQPEWASVLEQTHPIQPAKREGSHYYCPLVPTAIKHKWGLGFGSWDFLTR